MEINKYNEDAVDVILQPSDVESAVRQFICTCYPQFSKNWVINAKYNVGAIIMAATKDAVYSESPPEV